MGCYFEENTRDISIQDIAYVIGDRYLYNGPSGVSVLYNRGYKEGLIAFR